MTWFVVSLLAFIVAILAHCALVRLPGSANTVTRFLGAGGCVGVALVVALLRIRAPAIGTAAGIALYAFLCELYIFLFTLVMSSLSAAILIELRMTGNTLNPAAETGAELTSRRLVALERNGFLIASADGRKLTRKGHATVLIYAALRGFFRHI